jgi:hypothetical protein
MLTDEASPEKQPSLERFPAMVVNLLTIATPFSQFVKLVTQRRKIKEK